MKFKRENEMYGIVEKYLKRKYKSEKTSADLPNRKPVRIETKSWKGKPDIAGVSAEGKIYIAEGKFISKSRAAFHQCASQIKSLAPYYDYAYLFIPKNEWELLPVAEKKEKKMSLEKDGIGFITVSDKCEEILNPKENTDSKEENKNEIKQQLGISFSYKTIPTFNLLSADDAKNANKLLSFMNNFACTTLSECIQRVFNKKINYKEWSFTNYYEPIKEGDLSIWKDEYCFLYANYYPSDTGIEIDPFGFYLKDNIPCIWIFVYLYKNIKKIEKTIRNVSDSFGTHLYCYNDEDETINLKDIRKEDLMILKEKYPAFCIGHRIEIFGRNLNTLKKEIITLLKKARKLEE